ncbi:transposase [Umezakia ovalisporum]|uniref:transposase n=1 Tax=Umezakia ovalisporum TaxID=75695 RepID=UPI0035B728F5
MPSITATFVKRLVAYSLRREFPGLLKLPSLWTNSCFYSTAGQVSADVIKRYIEYPHHS